MAEDGQSTWAVGNHLGNLDDFRLLALAWPTLVTAALWGVNKQKEGSLPLFISLSLLVLTNQNMQF